MSAASAPPAQPKLRSSHRSLEKQHPMPDCLFAGKQRAHVPEVGYLLQQSWVKPERFRKQTHTLVLSRMG